MSQAIWSICLGLQPFAAAVIGPGCAIEASNAQAVDLWSRRSDLFGVADGRLALADATAQQKLTDSLQAAHVPPRQVIRCADPASGRLHWLVVSVLPADPVGPASATPSPADRRFLVSFRLSDEISVLLDPDRLMVDLGLTRSEARIAAARAEGSRSATMPRIPGPVSGPCAGTSRTRATSSAAPVSRISCAPCCWSAPEPSAAVPDAPAGTRSARQINALPAHRPATAHRHRMADARTGNDRPECPEKPETWAPAACQLQF